MAFIVLCHCNREILLRQVGLGVVEVLGRELDRPVLFTVGNCDRVFITELAAVRTSTILWDGLSVDPQIVWDTISSAYPIELYL